MVPPPSSIRLRTEAEALPQLAVSWAVAPTADVRILNHRFDCGSE
ncbi:hypothetical protein OAC76_03850 [Amylibacter sp.]|nr:hypothetical protein [Amylibacter sp.]MDB9875320.1 hypothetical protein [Amylibacter sp.]